jgi:hypothetical protein
LPNLAPSVDPGGSVTRLGEILTFGRKKLALGAIWYFQLSLNDLGAFLIAQN